MKKITPQDAQYEALAGKRFNKRFTGHPEYICMPESTQELVDVVQDAVNSNKRLVVRSGGHCLEGFVADPAVQVLVDMSLMNSVSYDLEKSAFMVEAGATVGEMYQHLFQGWGVLLPAGEHPGIGVGGHILGGAFGFLCREFGLAADHLYGIEMLGIDGTGKVYRVVATREESDPNRELCWGHTGGGGGNFGIVTRYWLRSPEAIGSHPEFALPKAPRTITTFRVSWDWSGFDEISFSRLVRNFGNWAQQNCGPDSIYNQLFSLIFLNHRNLGKLEMKGLCTVHGNAAVLIEAHLSAIADFPDLPYSLQLEESSWLDFALNPFPELFQPGLGQVKAKVKDALFREPLTDEQIATAYHYLTSPQNIGGGLGMATYGGKVNSVVSDATASAQRDCILDVACNVGWLDPKDEAVNLDWVRSFYQDLFKNSGGVPVPNEQTDGSLINHPDTDHADLEWNKSGIPWHTLYYKGNYPRLQQLKTKWDPLNIFHHALSIQKAED
ncbi:FAD-binding oxidoreductase [Pedobacter gandavensis]|uniref:FAD-binding protein n=1 Tax=Pedobacter gandavensis TaxID=2679963 RepID=A0ABR6EQW9_9SPHI|nr:FAD-binding oxidoreductase [Pedobacter gandavensis]MBB2147650.1 FAD-binding protein [Pedobacter gandavensis]